MRHECPRSVRRRVPGSQALCDPAEAAETWTTPLASARRVASAGSQRPRNHRSHERTRSPRTSQPISSSSAAARSAPHVLLRTRVPESQRRSRAHRKRQAVEQPTISGGVAARIPSHRGHGHFRALRASARSVSVVGRDSRVSPSAPPRWPLEPPKPGNVCARQASIRGWMRIRSSTEGNAAPR